MLETPTRGRYWRERYLIFEPAGIYMALVYACMIGGVGYALVIQMSWIPIAVALSGVWAYFSVTRIRFDLRNRSYIRQQGAGLLPKTWRGNVDLIDAVVVIAVPNLTAATVNYHIMLHWKGASAPPMVCETFTTMASPQLQVGGAHIVQRANQFGKSLNLPVFDNTYFASPNPVKVI